MTAERSFRYAMRQITASVTGAGWSVARDHHSSCPRYDYLSRQIRVITVSEENLITDDFGKAKRPYSF